MISLTFRSLLLCALFFIVGTTEAQTILDKADKQYELYAFNLAVESYLRATETQELDANACGRLADSYRHLNKLDKAAEWYARAVSDKEVAPQHILGYGKVLLALARYGEAESLFARYENREPGKGRPYLEYCAFAGVHSEEPPAFIVSPSGISSPASDFAPAIRGKELVYASSRVDIRRTTKASSWTGQASNRLFMAELGKDAFPGDPELLHAELRNAFNEGPVSFSPEGKTVAITRNNFVNGTRQIPSSGGQMSLFFADVDRSGDWTNPRPFAFNASGYSTAYPSFSPDGNALYFASDRPGGSGGFDIYVSYRIGESWTAPENLGPIVNSPGNEISPHFDGEGLYFASDLHPGLGGFDLFRAEISGTDWSRVYHLGTGINSGFDDYGLVWVPGTKFGFFTSNRPGGKGLEDIYRLEMAGNELTVRIIEASSGEPLPGVTLDLSECGEGQMTSDATGTITFRALDYFTCQSRITLEGYRPVELVLENKDGLPRQVFDIALVKEGLALEGMVVHADSGEGLKGILVEAREPSGGSSLKVRTNKKGAFLLAMEPGRNYDLRISGPGFVETQRTVMAGHGSEHQVLTISLVPTAPLADSGLSDMVAVADVLTEKGVESDGQASELPESAESGKLRTGTGFSVQLFSVDHVRIEKVKAIRAELSDIGNTYVTQDGAFQKVRVGIFPDRKTAEAARQKIESIGYSGTFIVTDQGILLPDKTRLEPELTAKGQEIKDAEPPTEQYMVRLATYSDTKWFDGSKLLDAGIIEKRQKGELTIMLLGGYSQLEDARRGLERARNAGFKEAYLVKEVNGELLKVTE